MDRKEANRLWREVSRGAPEGVPTGRTLHEFAQRVEALTIADFEARARKREAIQVRPSWWLSLVKEAAAHIDGTTGAASRPTSDSGDLYRRLIAAVNDDRPV